MIYPKNRLCYIRFFLHDVLMLSLIRLQPKAFSMIFILELWERFGFYTIQGIFILYFVRQLGFSETQAYLIFGAFYAIVYGLVPIGGYLGDSILGIKRTVVTGLITLAVGYLLLAIADRPVVFWALGTIAIGNGLFNANPTNLLSKCYEVNDERLHSGFTLYYMSINIGAALAFFVGPFLVNQMGYPYAYSASFIGIVFSLLNFTYNKRYIQHINSPADLKSVPLGLWIIILLVIFIFISLATYLLQHISLAKKLLILVIASVTGFYFYVFSQEPAESKHRMMIAFILMLEGIIFYILYQQMPTSLNLFAVHHVLPRLFGITIDPQSFQVLNPLGILSLAPFVAMIHQRLIQHQVHLSLPHKFALGMFFCGISFLILFFTRYVYNDHAMVSSWWLVLSYVFQSLGELFVSALGLAMVVELVPARMTGFAIGMWFLTTAIAGFLGASVASYTAIPQHLHSGVQSLMTYTKVFGYIGMVTVVISLFLWGLAAHLKPDNFKP